MKSSNHVKTSSQAELDKYNNPVSATLNGILDLFRKKERIGTLADSERLEGKTVLITGATSGLGKATAIQLAARGARVILAVRSGIPGIAEDIARAANSETVSCVHLDLSDLASVRSCCDELNAMGVSLDRVILNAGVVPNKALKTRQGFEMMFGVHFVANALLIRRLLEDGTIPNNRFARIPNGSSENHPRIVFVSSESHRSGTPIDFDTLGDFVEYKAMGSVAQYGHSKLVMTAWMQELARQLNRQGRLEVSVHCLCPGPVNSNIARDTPALFKPVMNVIMGILFAQPEKAAEPVMYLSCAQDIEGQTGIYLHLMTPKQPAPQARDEEVGQRVWKAAEKFAGLSA